MKKTSVLKKPKRVPDPYGGDDIEMVSEYVDVGDFIKFMVTYDDDIEDSKIIKYFGTNFGLLYKQLKHVVWSTCYFNPNGRVKKELCKLFNISDQMYEEHLRQYRRLNIMKKIEANTYMINPMKFFVGDYNVHIECCKQYDREVDSSFNKKGGSDA